MKEKKLPIIIFSLLFALLVWISVNLSSEVQTTIEVPIVILNLDSSKALAQPLPHSLTLKVRGVGWDIVNTILSSSAQYNLDMAKVSSEKKYVTLHNIKERFTSPHILEVINVQPESLTVVLDEKIKKRVPVIPQLDVQFHEGFGMVGSVRTSPESITVVGARSLLLSLSSWKTMPVSFGDVKTPQAIQTKIADTLQLETDVYPKNISLQFDVQPIAEKTINDIHVEISQAPENRTVVLIPSKVNIIIRSGVNNIAPLTGKDFYAFVDYKTILMDTSGTVQPKIYTPEYIQIVSVVPQRLQYVIRK